MGKKVTPPPNPNYSGVAQQQGQANVQSGLQTSQLSNPNIVNPYGSQTVTYDGNTPTVTQSLNPTAQSTLDAQQQAQLGAAGAASDLTQNGNLGTPFSFSGTPQQSLDLSGVAPMPVNAGMTGQQAIMQRLQPQIDANRTSAETQLINQGLRPGSEAYNNAIRNLGNQENDAYSQAALQGLNLDMGANQQGFGQALQSGQFGNQAQAQDFSQQAGAQNQNLSSLQSLLAGSQFQNAQFSPFQGANVAAAPIFQGAQAQNDYAQNLYNQQVAQKNSLMNGLFGLGGAFIGGPIGGLIGSKIGGMLKSKPTGTG